MSELNEQQITDNTNQFLSILSTVNRDGMPELIKWLQGTDFFSAPASTRFHEAYAGGLCEHSLAVYDKASQLNGFLLNGEIKDEHIIISALLHDLCKANFYKIDYRNVKNEAGQWIKTPYYTVEDQFPFGHSEKSVFLIERFIRLKVEEAVAIRWHMGGWDESVKGGSYAASGAYDKYPLATIIHSADFLATNLNK